MIFKRKGVTEKVISFFMAVVMMFSMLNVCRFSVRAEESLCNGICDEDLPETDAFHNCSGSCVSELDAVGVAEESADDYENIQLPLAASADSLDAAYEVIYNGVAACQTSINIRSYGLTVDELSSVVKKLLYGSPELFYLDNGYSYNYYISGGVNYVSAFNPNYLMSADEISVAKEYYESELSRIVSLTDAGWSDLEKVLFFHDYFAQQYCYDKNLYTGDADVIYDTYNFLVQKTGVCMAYALTMMAVLNELGIENTYAENAGHIWNVVNIDGSYYHVDVTWDDPFVDTTNYRDYFSMMTHEYFMKSDAAFESLGYDAWNCEYTCTDTRYDSETLWSSSKAPFVITDDGWYYVDSSSRTINLYDDITGTSSDVVSVGKWYVTGNSSSYWANAYTGLSYHDGYLIYNSSTGIYAYDTESRAKHLLESPDCSAGYVYGSILTEGTVEYMVAADYTRTDAVYGSIDISQTLLRKLILEDNSVLDIDEESYYLVNISAGTNSCSDITAEFVNMTSKISITGIDGDLLDENALVGTGCTVTLSAYGDIVDSVTVFMSEDTNGDGLTNIADAASVMSILRGNSSAGEVFFDAADGNDDGKVNIIDVMISLNRIAA